MTHPQAWDALENFNKEVKHKPIHLLFHAWLLDKTKIIISLHNNAVEPGGRPPICSDSRQKMKWFIFDLSELWLIFNGHAWALPSLGANGATSRELALASNFCCAHLSSWKSAV